MLFELEEATDEAAATAAEVTEVVKLPNPVSKDELSSKYDRWFGW